MNIRKLYDQYEEAVESSKEDFVKEYYRAKKEVEKSPAKYKGKPVEFLLQPIFLGKEDIERFRQLTDQLMGILNKVISQYLQDETFRSYFGFEPLLEQLILKEPGYDINVPMGRFDIFYHLNGNFQFCELNADGSSGMVEAREIQRIVGDSLPLKEFKDQYRLEDFEVFNSWAEALLENYRQFSGSGEKPQVAIVDWLEGNPPSEFVEFQKTFEAHGCPTVIADPRDLVYRENKLYYKDFRIDCVYRRAVTWEVVERHQSIQDFLRAYLDSNVCVVGSFRSQIIHNKIIFSILHDPMKTPFLTEVEREFIQKHIPYTAVFDIHNEQLVQFTIDNKDSLVLKPMDRYASHGVRIGCDYSLEQWKRIIEECRDGYLLQQFCNVPKLPMAMVKEDTVDLISNNYLIGIFMYNGKLQGIYTRAGTKNIIGSIVECYTVPNYIVDEK